MHNKESQAQLSARLAKAAQQVIVGGHYMHYKQLSYTVLALALREEEMNHALFTAQTMVTM